MYKNNLSFILIGVLLIMASCVPNKKLVYLQHDDLHDKNLPKDSVTRSYDMQREPYRIQPEDILMVTFNSLTDNDYDFFKKVEPQMQGGGGGGGGLLFALRGELVDIDGNIFFPIVGKIKVAGLTVYEIQDKLQSIANKYLDEPVVRVRLVNFRATFLGEVRREGVFTSVNPQISVMEAIGSMGGLTEMADRRNVKIIRQINGENHVFYIDLLKEAYLHSDFFWLHQNDIIVVPPLKQRTFATYSRQNIAIFASTISAALLVVNLIVNPPGRQ